VTLFYLASPYTHYPYGRIAAFERVLNITVKLLAVKIPVWSPIVYSHQFVSRGLPIEAEHWEFLDKAMLEACDGCMVYMLEGWSESKGIAKELEWIQQQDKPIWYIRESSAAKDVLEQIKGVFPE
jgi:hypothetical protein